MIRIGFKLREDVPPALGLQVVRVIASFLLGIIGGLISSSIYYSHIKQKEAIAVALVVLQDARDGIEGLEVKIRAKKLALSEDDCRTPLFMAQAVRLRRKGLRAGQPDLSSLLWAKRNGKQLHAKLLLYYDYLERIEEAESQAISLFKDVGGRCELIRGMQDLRSMYKEGQDLAKQLIEETKRFLE